MIKVGNLLRVNEKWDKDEDWVLIGKWFCVWGYSVGVLEDTVLGKVIIFFF